MKFNLAFITGGVVLNRHFAVVVKPQLSDDDVMDSRCNLLVGVVVAAVFEFDMCIS